MIRIGDRCIGDGQPCFVIAEAGVNHNGRLDLALRLVDVAADIGADAVKFQTFRTEELVTTSVPKAAYQVANTDAAGTQMDMLRSLELSVAAHEELLARARERGITFLSTPFDPQSADLLGALPVPAFKIGSGELTDLPLLRHVAAKGIPMIVSTGMSWLGEVASAVRAIQTAGTSDLVLLHCVSNYPAEAEDQNLRAMDTLRSAFGVPVGFSDHDAGINVAIAAAARGACVIEKHFTLDQDLPGPDHKASLEPDDFTRMLRGIREVERALGDGIKQPKPAEAESRRLGRKSVVLLTDVEAGRPLAEVDLGVRRPGTGIEPDAITALVGRALRADVRAGTPLQWEMLA